MNRELRPLPARYDEDLHRWSFEQAQLLRDGRFDALDLANIAEELDTLGRSEAAALRSSLRLIVLHLLKLTHQPERASRSWRSTVVRERNNAARRLAENPSLKAKLPTLFADAYEMAGARRSPRRAWKRQCSPYSRCLR